MHRLPEKDPRTDRIANVAGPRASSSQYPPGLMELARCLRTVILPAGGKRLGAAVTACVVALGCASVARASPTLVAAGDIACAPSSLANPTNCQQGATASLIQSLNPTAVAALGDEQYDRGTPAEFSGGYAPSWGAFQPLIRPVPGNHEYMTPGAAGYFGYFGAAAGNPSKGYYSYNLGSWHILALNSNCEFVSCAAGSAQEHWVRADLAAHPAVCTLAYWHHPLFTSGQSAGNADNIGTRPLWQALAKGGADVVLSGHDHDYERFAPQDAAGRPNPGGIREFVVGTGGKSLFNFGPGPVAANSETRDNTSFGVLQLTLDPTSYSWRYVPVPGSAYSDTGTAPCSPVLRLKLAFAHQALAHALRYGLRLTVTPSQPGRLHVVARLGWRVARMVGLARGRGRHGITVAASGGRTLRGKTAVRLVFTPAARRRLAGLHRVSLTVIAAFMSKNGTSVTRSSTITPTTSSH